MQTDLHVVNNIITIPIGGEISFMALCLRVEQLSVISV